MLPVTSNNKIPTTTLKFLSRFFWNYNSKFKKEQKITELELAEALNLIKPQQNLHHKPSIIKSFKDGPANEVYKIKNNLIHDSIPSINKSKNKHISNQFIQNILFGIKSSSSNKLESINYHQLLNEMTLSELRYFIRSVTDEKTLFNIMVLFNSNHKLNLKILTEIILNKNFIHIARSPINLLNLENETNLSQIDVIKVQILLLKKYQDLKLPINIIKNLKLNINNYLTMIKQSKLNSFYERIIWRFVYEYLFQFSELDYMKMINNIQSSFIMWEASYRNNTRITNDILSYHSKELNSLQTIFLQIALLKDVNLSNLKNLSIKYKIYQLDPNNKSNRNISYALITELEKLLIKTNQSQEVSQMLENLAIFRINYILNMYNIQNEEIRIDNEHLMIDRL
ncbi:unnamed protein product [Candida verbasci]|uniref:Uncharacterized protein n=1 Tax=Candida verbasci TaxID=1227364 RepID=A0A9W4XKD0_9ASCO|nr:unnamed protein product [Candida verbasci]